MRESIDYYDEEGVLTAKRLEEAIRAIFRKHKLKLVEPKPEKEPEPPAEEPADEPEEG